MFPGQRRSNVGAGRVFPSSSNLPLFSSTQLPLQQALGVVGARENPSGTPNLLSTEEEIFVRQYTEQRTFEFRVDANFLNTGQSTVSIEPSRMLEFCLPRNSDSLSRDLDRYSVRTVEELTPSGQPISNRSQRALPGPKLLSRVNPACYSTSTSSLTDAQSQSSTLHSSVKDLFKNQKATGLNHPSSQVRRDDRLQSSGSAAVRSNQTIPMRSAQPDMPTVTS